MSIERLLSISPWTRSVTPLWLGVWAGVVASSPGLARSQLQLGLDQGLATFALVCVVCSVEDQSHGPPALLVGLTVATITLTMGANAGASMNPAQDLAAR